MHGSSLLQGLLGTFSHTCSPCVYVCVLSGETKHRIYRTSVIPAFTGDVDVEFDPALGEIDNFALYGQFIFAEV